jgi:hypothetical protein
MIETTNKDLIQLLKTQIRIRDDKNMLLEKDKEELSISLNSCKQKYKKIIITILSFTILSLILNAYLLLY